MWVRSEYAGELAVLATWLTALLPWSVSFISRTPAGMDTGFTVLNIRFVLFQFHYLYGISFGEQSLGNVVQFVLQLPAFVPDKQELETWLWVGAAALYATLLALSFVYYAREDWLVERVPLDLVRVFGAAFAVLALAFTAATAMFSQHQTTIPIGALFMWVFAVVLFRVERT